MHVGQASAPEAGMELQERDDSIAADSLTVPADTVAVGAAASAPFSTNPAASPPALHNSAAETLPTPASRDPGFAGAHRSGALYHR
ncbi:MAG: hypothetical protein P8174_09730 [Gemmatimonadota bacterium]